MLSFRTSLLLAAAAATVSLPLVAQAPIERAAPGSSQVAAYDMQGYPVQDYPAAAPQAQRAMPPAPPQIASKQVAEGIWLRTAEGASVQTVSANDQGTELRVEHGIANVTVHHASKDALIVVDLPGGKTSLVKDGLYTFTAETNTVRVLEGEADVLLTGKEPVRVKEDHQFAFVPGATHASDASFAQLHADLLPAGRGANGEMGPRAYPAYGYAYGPYGDGVYPYAYPYPYYAYGPWGYPYGWYGYPYVGVGWGWGGGWGRGFRR